MPQNRVIYNVKDTFCGLLFSEYEAVVRRFEKIRLRCVSFALILVPHQGGGMEEKHDKGAA